MPYSSHLSSPRAPRWRGGGGGVGPPSLLWRFIGVEWFSSKSFPGGPCLAQPAERLTLDFSSGHDPRVMGSSPSSVPSMEPASDSLSLPPLFSHPHSVSVFLQQQQNGFSALPSAPFLVLWLETAGLFNLYPLTFSGVPSV